MKKTILLVLIILGLVAYIVFAAFANYDDVIADSSTAGNQHLKNSTIASVKNTAPIRFMQIPRFGEAVFFNNTFNIAASRQFSNTNGTQYWNWSGTNKTIEGWFTTNASKQTDFHRLLTFGDDTEELINIRLNQMVGVSASVATKGNLTVQWSVGGLCAGGQVDNVSLSTKEYYNDSGWHHFALVNYNSTRGGRDVSSIRLFIDGGLQDEKFPVAVDTCTDRVEIGGTTATASKGWLGGIDEIRISSSARYLDNFTRPTTAFTADAQTISIWRLGNGTASGLPVHDTVKVITDAFLNFSTKGMGDTNQFWINITNGTLAVIELTPPNGTVLNLTMSERAKYNFTTFINPTDTGTYNITTIYARNSTTNIDRVHWNDTKIVGLDWTVTEDLVFRNRFINHSGVQQNGVNQFWVLNRNATTIVITVEPEFNSSVFNFTLTDLGNDNFSTSQTQLVFPEFGFYNMTSIFANNSFSGNGNQTQFSDMRWQVTTTTNVVQCSSPSSDQAVAVNFTFFDELNQSRILNITKFTATFITLDLDNVTAKVNTSITVNNPEYVAICIQPKSHKIQTNATIFYEKDDYNFREFFYFNHNLTNQFENTSLFLLQATEATAITIQITDELDKALPNAITEVQRFYIGNNTFRTIGMIKAGDDGKDLIHLQKDEGTYRFRVLVNGVVQRITTGQKITATDLVIKIFGTPLANLITNLADITTSLQYNNDTGLFLFNWTDPNNFIDSACLKVVQHNSTGRFDKGQVCLNGTSSGGLTLFGGNGSATLFANGFVIQDGATYILASTAISRESKTAAGVWGLFGLLLFGFALVPIALTQAHNPVTLMGIVILFLVVAAIINLSFLPWVLAIGAIGGIVLMITQTRA